MVDDDTVVAILIEIYIDEVVEVDKLSIVTDIHYQTESII